MEQHKQCLKCFERKEPGENRLFCIDCQPSQAERDTNKKLRDGQEIVINDLNLEEAKMTVFNMCKDCKDRFNIKYNGYGHR